MLIQILSIFLLFFTLPVCCAHPHKDKSVVILPKSATHNGDYFAWGRTVEISGTVNGDVYLLAEQAVIDGTVNGDVIACAGSIDIFGRVAHNCRLIGGQTIISGQIGESVTVIAGNLQTLPLATIGGGVVAVAGNVNIASSIASNATIIASNLRLASTIQGNLQATVGQMRLASHALVQGNVDYTSNEEGSFEEGATVMGKIVHHPSFVQELVKGTWIQKFLIGSKVAAMLMNFFYSFVVGILLLKLFPGNLEAALYALQSHPWRALSYGVIVLILFPLVSLILLMSILGVPFALTLLAANVIGFYTAKIYTVFWLSHWVFHKIGWKSHRIPVLFCGLFCYFLLTAIPIAGTIVALAAMLFGLGAGLVAQTKRGIFTSAR